MEDQNLGEQAIGFLAKILRSSHVPDAASRELRRLVTDRLRASEFGGRALERFQENPEDRHRAAAASSVVNEEAENDPGFAEQLKTAVQQVHLSQGPAGGSNIVQTSHAAGAGSVSSQGSAGRDLKINAKSKKTLLGIGLAAVAVVSVTVIGGAVNNWFGGHSGDSNTSTGTTDGQGKGKPLSERSVASIGADPGEAGVRETWDAFADAVTRDDSSRACALMTPMLRNSGQERLGRCESFISELRRSSNKPYPADDDGRRLVLQSVHVEGSEACLILVPQGKPAEPAPPWSLDRFGDRWRFTESDHSSMCSEESSPGGVS
ncbi:hypothetical protein [Streptomyces sp. NEAU-YJ-81]|uniref:hypothetical protein n=1 Tax=Streptomyces sp. NEAU-YJ-81 TaxID=2820288 RepID=UPI001ABC7DFD|nr:hypothetical protein [Streptomyces sp. NEAU-YJ-81]MBO3676912.1 hypothetical protein [Streptomyces sp. NEAU-YJ-81]